MLLKCRGEARGQQLLKNMVFANGSYWWYKSQLRPDAERLAISELCLDLPVGVS